MKVIRWAAADPPTLALAGAAPKRSRRPRTICLRIPRWAQKNMSLCRSQEGEALPDTLQMRNLQRALILEKDPWRGAFPLRVDSVWLKNTTPNIVRSEGSHMIWKQK